MSAPAVNQVVLLGRLTKDPDSRKLRDGGSVCELRLAVNDPRERDALFIDVTTFGKQADACATYLKKGREVAVTGRLVFDVWEAKDGHVRSRHKIIGHVSFGNDQHENNPGPDGHDE